MRTSIGAFCAVTLSVLFLLSGCASLERDAVIADIEAGGAPGHRIEGVPFFPDDDKMCGPAALASVIGYWEAEGGGGSSPGIDEVAEEVYEEKLKGTLPIDLVIYAKEKGYEARYYRGSLEDLKKRLSKGTPLILFLNLGHKLYPVGHYIVATGYSDRLGAVLTHSGTVRKVFTYGELERLWGRTSYSTLLVIPKGKETH